MLQSRRKNSWKSEKDMQNRENFEYKMIVIIASLKKSESAANRNYNVIMLGIELEGEARKLARNGRE